MRFLILGSPGNYYVREFCRAATPRHQVDVRTFDQLAAWEGCDRGVRVEVDHQDLASWDGVLVHSMPRGSLEQIIFRMDVLGEFERDGSVVVNGPRSLETAIDKYLTLTRLAEAGMCTPRTYVCQRWQDAMRTFEELGSNVVVKPLFGGEGRGISRITDSALAERAFKLLEQLGAVIYVQQFVAHEGSDIRLLVVGQQVFGIRRHNGSDWRTNISQGGVAEPLIVSESMKELAHRAVRAVGATVAGVDVLPVRDGPDYVIEVNAVPGWRAVAGALGIDIASVVLEHLVRLVKRDT